MLIFSVDDFGIGQLANTRTLELVRAQKLSRVAIMPHGTIVQEEIKQLLEGNICLDVHLDIDGEISEYRKIKEGAFRQAVRFGIGLLLGRYSTRAVERIWEEQIEAFYTLFGRYPDGLNAHRHAHFFPPFFQVMVRLAKKYNISFVRLGQRGCKWTHPTALVLNVLRWFNLSALRKEPGIQTSDRLVSADWILSEVAENFFSKEETVEIVFHPERDEEFASLKGMEKEM